MGYNYGAGLQFLDWRKRRLAEEKRPAFAVAAGPFVPMNLVLAGSASWDSRCFLGFTGPADFRSPAVGQHAKQTILSHTSR